MAARRLNIAAIPLAAGVLAWAGFVLPMALAAVLMSASMVVVAINAQFLRRVKLHQDSITDKRGRIDASA